MGIYSTAHLFFGVPVNSEDHPQFWIGDKEEGFLEASLERFDEDVRSRLVLHEYGHYDADEDALQAILGFKGMQSFVGDPWGPGRPIKTASFGEFLGPVHPAAVTLEPPLYKDAVNATDGLRSAGIESIDMRDAAWYLVADVE